jgi:lipopolysaccharide heptosyltransferase II
MKILIIRFSSIGDVTQSLSIPAHILKTYPTAQIDILTKSEFRKLFQFSPFVKKIWTIEKEINLKKILKMSKEISAENYTHIYDAHNNLRSNLFYFLISANHKLQRPMMRLKRFMLLKFKYNLFEKPFSGQRDLLKPLEKWKIPFSLPSAPQLFLDSESQKFCSDFLNQNNLQKYIILVPSAAYQLKRWPINHWQKLIQINPNKKFIVLAGPADHFTKILSQYSNVINLTGQTTLIQSAALIEKASCVVTNDTGMLHFAEQLGIPTIALMGPAPFGFPSRPTTKILERTLNCRPCSKHGQGPCVNSMYQDCLVSITPEEVSQEMNQKC